MLTYNTSKKLRSEAAKRSAQTCRERYGDDFHSKIANKNTWAKAGATKEGRVCRNCKEFLFWSEFYKSGHGGVNGKKSVCKACNNIWRVKNMEKSHVNDRNSWLKKTYNLSNEEYWKIFDKQKGRCAICGLQRIKIIDGKRPKGFNKNTYLHVDHNHNTGDVRGLLCNGCNRGIGYFNDNIQSLASAVEYLNKQ